MGDDTSYKKKNKKKNLVDSTSGNKAYKTTQRHKYTKRNNSSRATAGNAVSHVPDPHLQLPPGGVDGDQSVARVAQTVKKLSTLSTPGAVAVDIIDTTVAIKRDIDNSTSRNTVETLAGVAGGWGGAFAGAIGGATAGTAILPGVGTAIGGIIGGIGGGITGQLGATALTGAFSDKLKYDVEEKRCSKCKKKFFGRRYLGERTSLCRDCR